MKMEYVLITIVIVILALIYLPAVFISYPKSNQTACTSNQKQIAITVLIYSQEHNEYMPVVDKKIFETLGLKGKILKCPTARSNKGYMFNGVLSCININDIKNPELVWMTSDSKNTNKYPVGYTSLDMESRHTGGVITGYVDTHVVYHKNIDNVIKTFNCKSTTPTNENLWNNETGIFIPNKENESITLNYATGMKLLNYAHGKVPPPNKLSGDELFPESPIGIFLNDFSYSIDAGSKVTMVIQFYLSSHGKTMDVIGKPYILKLLGNRNTEILRIKPIAIVPKFENMLEFSKDESGSYHPIEMFVKVKLFAAQYSGKTKVQLPSIDVLRYN